MSEIVNEVIDGRSSVYGDPVDGMKRTAQVWSGILNFEVRPDQVPLLLMGYKLVRASECPEYSDNSDDVEGYLDIFRKVVGEDMVHARSVSEFLEASKARDDAKNNDAAFARARADYLRGGSVHPVYASEKHSTDCIATIAVKSGDLVQCVCASGHTAGIWFILTDRSGL